MKTHAAITFSLALCALGLFCPEASRAEDAANYPSRQIRIVVPFPAGGTANSLPRIIAEKLRLKWSQTVIIDNRSGAGGNIGAEAVATSAPDAYTLLASPPGPIAINQTLYAKLSYDPSELKPVALIGTAPNVLDVRPDFPAKTVKELIAYAKANPDKVTFASQGNGSTSHLTAILFEKLTGTKMVHVPYRGTTPALRDIMGNTVDILLRQSRLVLEPAPRRPAADPRSVRPGTLRVLARRAHRSRVRRSRFHFRHLVRAYGAERHAGCDYTEVECDRYGHPER